MKDHSQQRKQSKHSIKARSTRWGFWSQSECELFQEACLRHGWGNWKMVARPIPTRTEQQVYSHARWLQKRGSGRSGNVNVTRIGFDQAKNVKNQSQEEQALQPSDENGSVDGSTSMSVASIDPASSEDEITQDKQDDTTDLLNHFVTNDWQAIIQKIESNPILAQTQFASGSLPLHLACEKKAPIQYIKTILEAYPDAAKTPNKMRSFPLHHLFYWSSSHSQEVILKIYQANPSAASEADRFDQFPIHWACRCKNVTKENIKLLLDANPEGIKVKDRVGRLPLHIACVSLVDKEVIEQLLEAYPRAEQIRDNFGKIPNIADVMGENKRNLSGKSSNVGGNAAKRKRHKCALEEADASVPKSLIGEKRAVPTRQVFVERARTNTVSLRDGIELEQDNLEVPPKHSQEAMNNISSENKSEDTENMKESRQILGDILGVQINKLYENVGRQAVVVKVMVRDLRCLEAKAQKWKEIEHTNNSLKKTNDQLLGDKRSLKVEVDSLKSSLEESKASVSRLESEKREMMSARDNNLQKINKLQSDMEKLQDDNGGLQKDNICLAEQVDDLNDDIKAKDYYYTQKLAEEVDEYKQLELKVERLESCLEKSQASITKLERENQEMREAAEQDQQTLLRLNVAMGSLRQYKPELWEDDETVPQKNISLTEQLDKVFEIMKVMGSAAKTILAEKKKMKEVEHTNVSLSTTNYHLKEDNQKLRDEMDRLKCSLEQSKTVNAESEKEKKVALAAEEVEHRATIELQAEIKTLKENNEQISRKYQGLRKENLDLAEQIERLNDALLTNENAVQSEKNTVRALEELEDENNQLNTKAKDLKSSLEKLKQSNEKLEKENQNVMAAKENNQQALHAVQGKFETLQKECQNLRRRNVSLAEEVGTLSAVVESANKTISAEKGKVVEVQQRNELLSKTNNQLMSESQQFKDEAKELKLSLENLEDSSNKLAKERQEASAAKKKDEETIVKLQAEIGNLRCTNGNLNEDKEGLQKEIDRLTERIERIDEDLNRKKNEIQDLAGMNQQLKKETEEGKREATVAKGRMQQVRIELQKEVKELRLKNQQMQEDNEEIKESNQILRRKNIDLTEQVNELNRNIKRARKDGSKTIGVLARAYERLDRQLADYQKTANNPQTSVENDEKSEDVSRKRRRLE